MSTRKKDCQNCLNTGKIRTAQQEVIPCDKCGTKKKNKK